MTDPTPADLASDVRAGMAAMQAENETLRGEIAKLKTENASLTATVRRLRITIDNREHGAT